MDMWGAYRMLVSIQSSEALIMTFHHVTEQVAIKFHFDGDFPVAYTRFYTGNLEGLNSQYFCIPGYWHQDSFTQWVEPEHITKLLAEMEADPSWEEVTAN